MNPGPRLCAVALILWSEFEAQNLVYFKPPELQLSYYSHMRQDEEHSTQNPAVEQGIWKLGSLLSKTGKQNWALADPSIGSLSLSMFFSESSKTL